MPFCQIPISPIESQVSSLLKYKALYVDRNTKTTNTAQKMKFSIKDFFSKCDKIRRKRI